MKRRRPGPIVKSMNRLKTIMALPGAGRIVWLLFAVLFFYSGLYTTEWLMQPEQFAGGWRWLLVGLFPVLLPMFFLVNRRYGCASGACRIPRQKEGTQKIPMMRMPGA